jgi:hypothetical protein
MTAIAPRERRREISKSKRERGEERKKGPIQGDSEEEGKE